MKTKKQTYYYYVQSNWHRKPFPYVALWEHPAVDLYGRKFVRVKITVTEVENERN
jgi:hypothetical protein